VKLVEQCSGIGGVLCNGRSYARIPYSISRFQGLSAGGMPVPGRHRIEGTVQLDGIAEAAQWVGASLMLELEDGRTVPLTLADADGRVLAEGHGPRHGCSCC
jgi:hypothetical protein